jgi:hypothetical protein
VKVGRRRLKHIRLFKASLRESQPALPVSWFAFYLLIKSLRLMGKIVCRLLWLLESLWESFQKWSACLVRA